MPVSAMAVQPWLVDITIAGPDALISEYDESEVIRLPSCDISSERGMPRLDRTSQNTVGQLTWPRKAEMSRPLS
ncbi:unnamed protein product [Protopolystoma xenopodis]|uniref:Uncharacterized protein n=1 Tax=Protopolystoma xenopodis TaxID=117903 RepID=A0A448WZ53_9PLAT|nr:unnamed protein product [Protopolystoma xenopodis]